MARSFPSSASAIPLATRCSQASSSSTSMGSSERLPLVITSACTPRSPQAASRRCCSGVYGSMTPSSGRFQATASASIGFGPSPVDSEPVCTRRRSSTMGRTDPVSRAASALSTSQTPRTSSSVRIITASGLLLRRLRRRSSRTAASLPASHARWNPPRPLMATMLPAASRCAHRPMIASLSPRVAPTAGTRGSSPLPVDASSRHVRCGPHAKQASGCAWKRRSAGSAYSRAQRGHMGNAAIDVLGRS